MATQLKQLVQMYFIRVIKQDDRGRNTTTWRQTIARALNSLMIHTTENHAQHTERKSVTLPDCFTFPCLSTNLDRSFCITIYRNASIPSSDALPTLYLTDSVVNFPIAYGAIQIMRFQGGMRDFNLVGIGYEDVTTSTKMRFLDLTPCSDEALAGRPMGGACDFAQAIRDDIVPTVERLIACNGERAFIGHSLGGLFGWFHLLNELKDCERDNGRKMTFQKYALGSPSLHWGGEFICENWKNLCLNDENNALDGTVIEIYSSIGELEGEEGENPQAQLDRFLEQAKAKCKRLRLSTEVLSHENHCSSVPLHISRTIRQFFIDQPITHSI